MIVSSRSGRRKTAVRAPILDRGSKTDGVLMLTYMYIHRLVDKRALGDTYTQGKLYTHTYMHIRRQVVCAVWVFLP